MKQTLEEAVNEIGGVHPDWDKITCFRIGFSLAYCKNHVQQAGQWSCTKLGGANLA